MLSEVEDGVLEDEELLPALEPIVSDELEVPLLPPVRSVSVDEEPIDPELEPELIVPGVLPELSGRVELAPEPAPEPMLPEVESREDDDDERLEESGFFCCHFWNSDWDSEPSLLLSAVLKPELSSDCIAASVWEMRPSRFASSDVKVAAAPDPEVPEPVPMLLLLEPMLPLLWLCCDGLVPWLEGVELELLCP